jgi:hypothetical protein
VAIIPARPVPAPEPLGLRYGLFTVATGPLPMPANAGAGGLTWEPVSCGTAHAYPADCHTDDPDPKTFDLADPFTSAAPFTVYSTFRCGAAGHNAAQVEAIVRQRLANGEQSAVEEQLADVLADAVTADATALTAPDPTSLRSVVGELEQWLYGDQGYGQIGFLHAPFRAAAYADMLVVREGNIMKTRLGTRWVFGNYPDGEIFISGHVTVWRDAEILVPPAAQTLDRATNQWNGIAEREYAVGFDCVAASAEFDHGAPAS